MFNTWSAQIKKSFPLLWLSINNLIFECRPYRWFAVFLLITAALQPATISSLHDLIETLFPLLVLVVTLVLMWLDIPKTLYNLEFKQQKWWTNTGITAQEIINDQGLYGEYLATIAAEFNIKHRKIYGQVFNNVIIPKKDGDFNEIDVLLVCEAGIFVIEAKARRGTFRGSATSDIWEQTIGREVHELQNPFIQNLGHCNYLTEYLYEKLPADISSGIAFRNIMVNTVLFALPCDLSKINFSNAIRPYCINFTMEPFGRCFMRTDLIQIYGYHLTPSQIDAIADTLRPISFYSKSTREQMYTERKIWQDHGAFRHPSVYYIVNGMIGTPYNRYDMLICRDNGYYKTYMDMNDGMFHALPSFQINEILYRSSNVDDVVNEYYRRR